MSSTPITKSPCVFKWITELQFVNEPQEIKIEDMNSIKRLVEAKFGRGTQPVTLETKKDEASESNWHVYKDGYVIGSVNRDLAH